MKRELTKRAIVILPVLLALPALGAPWHFQDPVDVSVVNRTGVFHHLGSGGRFGIAVSETFAAVTWEDNRDGTSRCYVALIDPRRGSRLREWRVSGEGPAFEPAVVALPADRFAVAWEEQTGAWMRIVDAGRMGPALHLDGAGSAHLALSWNEQRGLVAAWARPDAGARRIWLGFVDLPRDPGVATRVRGRMPVEDAPAAPDQSYPSLVAGTDGRLVVAWEDRRRGHTVIMGAVEADGGGFPRVEQINESFWGGRELGLGSGAGAMRVTLARESADTVVAVWADKRNFRSGYDVYSAFSRDASGERFGKNQKVQDAFADLVAQWHPSVASNHLLGQVVAAWDDDRNQSPDVWISWRDGEGWSDDLSVVGASGDGVQVEPAIALDETGHLHAAWVDKASVNAPSRVRYLFAPGRQ